MNYESWKRTSPANQLYSVVAGLGCVALGVAMTLPDFISGAVVGIGTAATVIGAFYGALAYHRPPNGKVAPTPGTTNPRRAVWLMAGLAVIAWGAVGFNYYDRHYVTIGPDELIEDYGWSNSGPGAMGAYMGVDGNKLSDYADKYKMLFVLRASFSNIDRMSDPFIAKSVLYTITPEKMALGIPNPKLRINPGQLNLIEFNLAVIPAEFSADQIATLADIQRIGGKILQTRGKTDVLMAPPSTAAPPPQK